MGSGNDVDGFGPMICYVAIWEDRHTDTEVYVFSDKSRAIEWAKANARKADRHSDLDEAMTEPMRQGGWLYYGGYSCEGDHLRVVECVVDSAT